MLQLLRDSHNDQNICLTAAFLKDLKWFQVFLTSYNGITFYHQPPLHKRIYLDASLEGLGGCYDNFVYALRIPRGYKDYNIAHLEILNVVVALKIWAPCRANKSIQIMCDNMAMVEVLSSGRARDSIMATCARNVWLLAAMFNVNIIVSHIRGWDNSIADLLSRWHLTVHNIQELHNLVENPLWIDTQIDLTLLNHDI